MRSPSTSWASSSFIEYQEFSSKFCSLAQRERRSAFCCIDGRIYWRLGRGQEQMHVRNCTKESQRTHWKNKMRISVCLCNSLWEVFKLRTYVGHELEIVPFCHNCLYVWALWRLNSEFWPSSLTDGNQATPQVIYKGWRLAINVQDRWINPMISEWLLNCGGRETSVLKRIIENEHKKQVNALLNSASWLCISNISFPKRTLRTHFNCVNTYLSRFCLSQRLIAAIQKFCCSHKALTIINLFTYSATAEKFKKCNYL